MAITASSRGTTVSTTGTTWANTSNAFDGTVGTASSTYATLTTSSGGSLTVAGYSFAGVSGSANAERIYAKVRFYVSSSSNWTSYNLRAYVNGGAIGSQVTNTTIYTSATETTLTLTGVTLSQFLDPTFGIRFTINRSENSGIAYIDYIDAYVDYSASSGWGSLSL